LITVRFREFPAEKKISTTDYKGRSPGVQNLGKCSSKNQVKKAAEYTQQAFGRFVELDAYDPDIINMIARIRLFQ